MIILQRHNEYCCFNCNTQFANSKKLNKHIKHCVSLSSNDNYSKNKHTTTSSTNGIYFYPHV